MAENKFAYKGLHLVVSSSQEVCVYKSKQFLNELFL